MLALALLVAVGFGTAAVGGDAGTQAAGLAVGSVAAVAMLGVVWLLRRRSPTI
jgi:uncharacterized protein (TIGR03382 family)